MIHPINTQAVIRDGGAIGRLTDEIHEAVAWWLGASLVVTLKTHDLVVAHNGHSAVIEFAARLCRGATNAEHYACHVRCLGSRSEDALLQHMKETSAPGAFLTVNETDQGLVARITLYTADGTVMDEPGGLAKIRSLIDEDRVPRPVNDQAKGRIEHLHPELPLEGDPS